MSLGCCQAALFTGCLGNNSISQRWLQNLKTWLVFNLTINKIYLSILPSYLQGKI